MTHLDDTAAALIRRLDGDATGEIRDVVGRVEYVREHPAREQAA